MIVGDDGVVMLMTRLATMLALVLLRMLMLLWMSVLTEVCFMKYAFGLCY